MLQNGCHIIPLSLSLSSPCMYCGVSCGNNETLEPFPTYVVVFIYIVHNNILLIVSQFISDTSGSAASLPNHNKQTVAATSVGSKDDDIATDCSLCRQPFGSDECYNSHVNLVVDTGYVRYQCQMCSYKVMWRKNMLNHLRTHTGETVLSCDQCSYKTNLKQNLRHHLNTKHKR